MARLRTILMCCLLSALMAACGGAKIQKGEPISVPEAIIFASDKGGTINYYWIAPSGGESHLLDLGKLPQDAVVEDLQWVSAWQKFIFSASTGSDSDIYTVEPGGKNLVDLTKNPNVFESSPTVSPDGKYIAFVAVDLDLDILVMKADGSDRKNLTAHPARDTSPAWLPEDRIAFSSNRQGTPNIYSMNMDGTDLKNVSNGPGLDSTFSVSPDGKKIAFDSDRSGNMDIFTVNIDGTGLQNLTNNPATETEPRYSPDGKKIALRSKSDGKTDLFTINADGTSLTNLTNTPDQEELAFTWSPDSQQLAFSTKYKGQGEIFLVGMSGSAPINLTQSPTNEFGPIWVKIK